MNLVSSFCFQNIYFWPNGHQVEFHTYFRHVFLYATIWWPLGVPYHTFNFFNLNLLSDHQVVFGVF